MFTGTFPEVYRTALKHRMFVCDGAESKMFSHVRMIYDCRSRLWRVSMSPPIVEIGPSPSPFDAYRQLLSYDARYVVHYAYRRIQRGQQPALPADVQARINAAVPPQDELWALINLCDANRVHIDNYLKVEVMNGRLPQSLRLAIRGIQSREALLIRYANQQRLIEAARPHVAAFVERGTHLPHCGDMILNDVLRAYANGVNSLPTMVFGALQNHYTGMCMMADTGMILIAVGQMPESMRQQIADFVAERFHCDAESLKDALPGVLTAIRRGIGDESRFDEWTVTEA